MTRVRFGVVVGVPVRVGVGGWSLDQSLRSWLELGDGVGDGVGTWLGSVDVVESEIELGPVLGLGSGC